MPFKLSCYIYSTTKDQKNKYPYTKKKAFFVKVVRQKKKTPSKTYEGVSRLNYLLISALKVLPAVKASLLDAGIVIASFVKGFLPTLSLRSFTSNVPKPAI